MDGMYGKVIKFYDDPRLTRLKDIEAALQHPERLTDEEMQELSKEMLEIDFDLRDNPAEGAVHEQP